MCGRFALGVDASELREQLARQYFGGGGGERHQADQLDQPEGGSSGGNNDEEEDESRASREPSLFDRVQGQQGEEAQDGGSEFQSQITWGSSESQSSWRPRYNVAPKSGGVVVRRSNASKRGQAAYELDVLKWGLVPHWTKNPQEDPPSTINAQMESVFEGRPTWKVRDSKRCIVVAQGFYEWVTKGKDKVPHFIKRADGKLMLFAGLWDHCEYKGNFDPVTSYTIITTPVNKQLRQIHSRMPAILSDSPSDIQTWLSTRTFDDAVKALIKPFTGKLEFYPVDKGVGKVGNDSKDFIKPVAQKAGSLDSLFAKQKSTPSKPTSSSPSLAKDAGPKVEDQEIIMNPDEDTKVKTEQLEKVEEEEEEKTRIKLDSSPTLKSGTGQGKGKKRQVETLELSSDDDEGEQEKEGSKGKKRKVIVGDKKSPAVAEKKTDKDGNVKLEGFFKVLD